MNLESDQIEHELVIKRQIWVKFERRMKAWLREQALSHSLLLESLEMKPDVIVIFTNQTSVFKTQNQKVSEWLHEHCHLPAESVSGHTEFQVHPTRCKKVVEDLKAAGFEVAN